MGARNDFNPHGVRDRLGIPNVSYPTPVLEDLIIVEDIPMSAGYQPVTLGTPRPGQSTQLLAWQGDIQGDGMKKIVRRIYVTNRKAQDSYNEQIRYLNNDAACPIFIRTYIELRENYNTNKPIPGTTLQKVIRITVTNGGTGYTSAPAISFSGGAGTGATATAEVQSGIVVAIRMTDCGSGFTSVPTVVFTGGGGASAAATAVISTGAILIEERTQPAPGELSGLYLQVVRIYQTFPGPWLVSYVKEPETGLTIRQRRRIVTQPSAPTQASYYDKGIQETDNYLVSVETEAFFNGGSASGTARAERRFVEYTFPALLSGINLAAEDYLVVDVNGNVNLRQVVTLRTAFTDIVPCLTVITYGPVGSLTPTTPFAPNPIDVIYSGEAFSVNIRRVLTDAFSLTYTTGDPSENPKYPTPFTETLTVGDTPLSVTQYSTKVTNGDLLCIGAVVKPWRFGLERMEESFVLAR